MARCHLRAGRATLRATLPPYHQHLHPPPPLPTHRCFHLRCTPLLTSPRPALPSAPPSSPSTSSPPRRPLLSVNSLPYYKSSPLCDPYEIFNEIFQHSERDVYLKRATARQRKAPSPSSPPAEASPTPLLPAPSPRVLPSPLLRPADELPEVGSLSILSLACERVHSLIDDINDAEYHQSYSTLQHDPLDFLSPLQRERRMREWRLLQQRAFTPGSTPPRASIPLYWTTSSYWRRWEKSMRVTLEDPAPLPLTSASTLRHQLDLELSLLLSFFHTLPSPSYAHYQLITRALTRATLPMYLDAFFDLHSSRLPGHLAGPFLSAFVRVGDVARAYLSLCRLRQLYGRVKLGVYERLMEVMARYGEWEWCERLLDEATTGKQVVPQVPWLRPRPFSSTLFPSSVADNRTVEWDAADASDSARVRLQMQLHLVTAYAKAGKLEPMRALFSTILSSPQSSFVQGSLPLEDAVCAMVAALTHRNEPASARSLMHDAAFLLPSSPLPKAACKRKMEASMLLPFALSSRLPTPSEFSLLSALTDVMGQLSLFAQAALYRESVVSVEGNDWIGADSHQVELKRASEEKGTASRGERRVRAEWEKRMAGWYLWMRRRVDRGSPQQWTGERLKEKGAAAPQLNDEEGDEDPKLPLRHAISLSPGALRLQQMYHLVLCFLASPHCSSDPSLLHQVLADARLMPLHPTTWSTLLSSAPRPLRSPIQRAMRSSLQPLTPAVVLAFIERSGTRSSLVGVDRLWSWLLQRGIHRSRPFYRKVLWTIATSPDKQGSVPLLARVLTAMRDCGYDLHEQEVHPVLIALIKEKAWPAVRQLYEELRRYQHLLTPTVTSRFLSSVWSSEDVELVQAVWGDIRGRETDEHRWMLLMLMSQHAWDGMVPYLLTVVTILKPSQRAASAPLVPLVLMAACDRAEEGVKRRAELVWSSVFPREVGTELAWLAMCRLLLYQVELEGARDERPEEERWQGWGVRLGISRAREEELVYQLTHWVAQRQPAVDAVDGEAARDASTVDASKVFRPWTVEEGARAAMSV